MRDSGRGPGHPNQCRLANQLAFCTVRNLTRIKNNHPHENPPDFAMPRLWRIYHPTHAVKSTFTCDFLMIGRGIIGARLSDSAPMAYLEWVDYAPELKKEETATEAAGGNFGAFL